MYHGRFKGTHYAAGYKWGELLYKNNIIISNKHTFVITEERRKFANQCLPIYKKHYPEILEEIAENLKKKMMKNKNSKHKII